MARPTTTQRGLGARHQAERRASLAVLVDGTPCRYCGHPMYHPRRCPPCQLCTLDLDHTTPRVFGGQGPRLLTHRRCNRQAGARLGNRLRAVRAHNPRW